MKIKDLRILQIGLGSMGKRRIRNLIKLGIVNIVGFDLSEDRRVEAERIFRIKTIGNIKEEAYQEYDAFIISTPPDKHGDYIRLALREKKNFFVEVTTSRDAYEDILRSKDTSFVKAPSCTFRFFEPIKKIKQILNSGEIGKVLAFQYHMGQYLPDWHPWEDYRKVYFSKKETGACREMLPFELIWHNWLVESTVKKIVGYSGKVSNLEMDADDIFASTVVYKNKVVGHILIDVVSRKPFRTLRVLTTNGVLDWNWLDSKIVVFSAVSGVSRVIDVDMGNPKSGYLAAEEMYNDEMDAFVNAVIKKGAYPYTFKEDYQNLLALESLENFSNKLFGDD